jgi:hypothetical protein
VVWRIGAAGSPLVPVSVFEMLTYCGEWMAAEGINGVMVRRAQDMNDFRAGNIYIFRPANRAPTGGWHDNPVRIVLRPA